MNKTAGIVVVVGLVVIAAWLLLTGKTSIAGTTSGATGAVGKGVNSINSGAPTTNEFPLIAGISTLLSGIKLLGPNETGNVGIAQSVGSGLALEQTSTSQNPSAIIGPVTPANIASQPVALTAPALPAGLPDSLDNPSTPTITPPTPDLSSVFGVSSSFDTGSDLTGSLDLSSITDSSGDIFS